MYKNVRNKLILESVLLITNTTYQSSECEVVEHVLVLKLLEATMFVLFKNKLHILHGCRRLCTDL